MANLNQLNPIVRKAANDAIAELASMKIFVFISQAFRTAAEQRGLFAIGRTVKGAGVSKSLPMGRTVTNSPAGWSYHEYGLAIDIAFSGKELYPEKKINDAINPIWLKVANVFHKHGFEWGESFGDWPHFDMTFGLSIKQLINGVKPPTSMPNLADRFKGEFILAVDQNGAIYYVKKSTGTKKLIPAGMSIEEFIKKTGDVTGMKNSDLDKIPND